MEPQQARIKLNYALRKGLVSVSNICSMCGAKPGPKLSRAQFIQHHEDYDKPLETITLYCSCHAKLHILRRRNAQI